MFYISKYISNTWYKWLANAVSSIKMLFQRRKVLDASNVENKLSIQRKINIDIMVRVSKLKLQCWFNVEYWLISVATWIQPFFNVETTLRAYWEACALINRLRWKFWHCLFKNWTLPESFQTLWFFSFAFLIFSGVLFQGGG